MMPEASPSERAAALIEQLYDNALLVEGLHPNPSDMVARIQTLMEAAAVLASAGVAVQSVVLRPLSMEDVFVQRVTALEDAQRRTP